MHILPLTPTGAMRSLRIAAAATAGSWAKFLQSNSCTPSAALRFQCRTQATSASRSSRPTPNSSQQHGYSLEENAVEIITPQSPAYYTGNAKFYDTLYKIQQSLGENYLLLGRAVKQDENSYVELIKIFKSMDQIQRSSKMRLTPAQYDELLVYLAAHYVASGDRVTPLTEEFALSSVTNKRTTYVYRELDENGIAHAKGSRKTSRARISVGPGTGEFLVNGTELADYFTERSHLETVIYPLQVAQCYDAYNVWAVVDEGGPTGQAGAIANALARALVMLDANRQKLMESLELIMPDNRQRERKKAGQVGARTKYRWVKR